MSGKPVEGAAIVAVGTARAREAKQRLVFHPSGEEQQILAKASSDREGKFVLEFSRFDPAVLNVDVIAQFNGMGLTARNPARGLVAMATCSMRP